MKKQILKAGIKIKKFPCENEHSFFGYYGKSPWNKDGRYAIFLGANFIDKHPGEKDSVDIILIDFKKKQDKKIAKTFAWNWQQGCMMQWLGPDYERKIIFNDRKNGKLISRIFDIKTKKEKIIPYTIYDVDHSGKYALSISFEKLDQVRRGYGYFQKKVKTNERISKKEGIYLINLKTGKDKLIINLKDLLNYQKLKSMNKGEHWIDQPVFDLSGKRLCFLHRWEIKGGLFHSRFFSADINGKNLFMFPDSGFYSHFTWRNPEEILMFCSVSEKFGNVRKDTKLSNFIIEKIRPIYRKIVPRFLRKRVIPIGYYLLKDQTNLSKKINIYNDDGHPSFSKNSRFLITDTYPDSKNYRKLILYDWKKDKRKVLGKFYSLPENKYLKKDIKDFGNSPFRVDLHPRWNFQGDKVCFDSIHEGKRGVYSVDLNTIILPQKDG